MVVPRVCRLPPAVWGWAVPGMFAAVLPARAGDGHYMMVFSAQSALNLPSGSHTFAVFARVADRGPCRLEYHNLSWMPANLNVRVVRLWPQAGRNVGLNATLDWAASHGDRVSM